MALQPIRQDKKNTNRGYKIALAILVIIIIALVISNPAFGIWNGDKAKAEENVKAVYNLLTGSNAEIIKTVDQNGLYKISVRFKDASGRDTIQDLYVTRDGALFTDTLQDLELQKSILINQSAFAQCLSDKQARVIGLSTDTGTQAQLQALGSFSGRIYFDCGGDNLAICQQLNITQVPVIFYNGNLIQGPQNLQWFEQNLGCYMTVDGKPAA